MTTGLLTPPMSRRMASATVSYASAPPAPRLSHLINSRSRCDAPQGILFIPRCFNPAAVADSLPLHACLRPCFQGSVLELLTSLHWCPAGFD